MRLSGSHTAEDMRVSACVLHRQDEYLPTADHLYGGLPWSLLGTAVVTDLASLVPLELFFASYVRVWELLKANRLLRLHRVVAKARQWNESDGTPAALLRLVALLLSVAHVIACGWCVCV
jgi:hypothetical protein